MDREPLKRFPVRMFVELEFPGEAALLAWRQSPEDRELARMRELATRSRVVVIQGLSADGQVG